MGKKVSVFDIDYRVKMGERGPDRISGRVGVSGEPPTPTSIHVPTMGRLYIMSHADGLSQGSLY